MGSAIASASTRSCWSRLLKATPTTELPANSVSMPSTSSLGSRPLKAATVIPASGSTVTAADALVPSSDTIRCFVVVSAVQYEVILCVGTSAANRSRSAVTSGPMSSSVLPSGAV